MSSAESCEPTFSATRARRAESDRREPAEILAVLKGALAARRGTGKDAPIVAQLFDARAVAGPLHLASAVARAARARARGLARLDDPGAEVALYLAGTDQLPEAIARVGLRADSRTVLLVLSPAQDEGPLLSALGLQAEPAAFPVPVTEEGMARLGFDREDLRSVPPGRWEALAVEAGALVELPRGGPSRRKGAPAPG